MQTAGFIYIAVCGFSRECRTSRPLQRGRFLCAQDTCFIVKLRHICPETLGHMRHTTLGIIAAFDGNGSVVMPPQVAKTALGVVSGR